MAHQFSTIDNYVISFFFFVFVLFQSCVEGICSVCSGVVRRVDVPNWYVRLRLLFIVVVVVVVEQNKPRFAGETVAKEPINNPCLLTIVGCFFFLFKIDAPIGIQMNEIVFYLEHQKMFLFSSV